MRKVKGKGYFSRERWVYFLLVVFLVLIFSRLLWLQVFQSPYLQAKGVERRTVDQSLLPERGTIYDAQGHVLAQSMPVKEVYADPMTLNQLISKGQYTKMSVQEIAQQLGTILEVDPKTILGKLSKAQAWVSLAHQVDLHKVEQIMLLKIPGLGFNDEEKRIYPMDSIAASVLGIINLAGHGVEGLEAFYENELYGKPGFTTEEQDTGQRSIVDALSRTEAPRPGNNLTLTLDSTIQYLVEQQLDDLEKSTKAKSVTIIAMDPKTGKILAEGTRPTFNPNNYSSTNAEDRRNRAISMTYEPGSTFKIVTGSAALEEGAVLPEERFSDPGYLRVGPRLITNWDSDQKPHGNPTFTEGMKLSSNVVLAQVGLKLGKNSFYRYLKAFGFGAKTGVDIAGEESGLLVPLDKVRDIELATMSFGQANLVTPIQMLTAICAVANGGTLYQPYIVEKVTAPDGSVLRQNKPSAVRQVVSKSTATEMTKILEKVVAEGTGHSAAIPGVNVAGKTGTAQKVDSKTGQYSKTDFIASFAAYAPAEDPKIALLIVIDSPQGDSHQGGTLGGPRAKAILEGALQFYGVPVAKDTRSTVSVSPNDAPVRPVPKPITPERQPLSGEVVVPDLTGMTMRQVGESLGKLELHFNFSGSGLAYIQIPSAGKVVTKGTRLDVKFSSFGQPP
ncbi:MAG: penicillin-binding protein [Desulfitobacteriaceae bacterium]